jgi:S-adenosylmethionine synthetase
VKPPISDATSFDVIFSAKSLLSRVAAETLTNTGLIACAGCEITTNAHVDYIQVARDTIKRIGYDNTDYGIDYKWLRGHGFTDKQRMISPRVDHASGRPPEHGRWRPRFSDVLAFRRKPGADASADLLRATFVWSSAKRSFARMAASSWPDRRSQVMRYVTAKPHSIDTVVLSTQHHPDQSELG